MAKMKYVGKGFLTGIPARDLTAVEVRWYGAERLERSGLYKEFKPLRKAKLEIVEPEKQEQPMEVLDGRN